MLTVGVELGAADVSVAVVGPSGRGVVGSVAMGASLELQHHVVVFVEQRRVGLDAAVRVHGDVDLVQISHAGSREAGVAVLIVGVQVQQFLSGDFVENASGREGVSGLEVGHSQGTVVTEVAGSNQALVNRIVSEQQALGDEDIVSGHDGVGNEQLTGKRQGHLSPNAAHQGQAKHRKSQHKHSV